MARGAVGSLRGFQRERSRLEPPRLPEGRELQRHVAQHLAACQVVVEEQLYPADYLVEQTDLPFLVRSDTARFLRESDVVEGGLEDRFDERNPEFWTASFGQRIA